MPSGSFGLHFTLHHICAPQMSKCRAFFQWLTVVEQLVGVCVCKIQGTLITAWCYRGVIFVTLNNNLYFWERNMAVVRASFQQPICKDQNLLLSPILTLCLLLHWHLWIIHYKQHPSYWMSGGTAMGVLFFILPFSSRSLWCSGYNPVGIWLKG